MKYKSAGIVACIVMLLISAMNLPNLFGDDTGRYHQHLEAEEKASCSHNSDVFCTHLPILSINTDGKEIPGKAIKNGNETVGYTIADDGSDRIKAQIDVFDSDTNNNHLTDIPTIESDMTIHVRGNSSRTFDKLGYRINLLDKNEENNPQALLGMDAHHEWALHGPFLDKTLMRNYMWYNIGGEIMGYIRPIRENICIPRRRPPRLRLCYVRSATRLLSMNPNGIKRKSPSRFQTGRRPTRLNIPKM